MSGSALSSVGAATGLALGLARSGLVSSSCSGSVIDRWGKSQGLNGVGGDRGLNTVSRGGSVGLLGGGGDIDGDSHGHSSSRGDDLEYMDMETEYISQKRQSSAGKVYEALVGEDFASEQGMGEDGPGTRRISGIRSGQKRE